MGAPSIKDQVYEGILNDILDGVYDVNSVIKEKDMIEKYKVSKTPVREALVQLCGDNILRNIPRFGYQLVAITPQNIIDVIEFRKIIETGALTSCFFKLNKDATIQLRELTEQTAKIEQIHDQKIHWRRNMDFHRKLCSFCKNSYLQDALENALRVCTVISNQYYTMAWSKHRVTGVDQHENIITAIEEKNLEKAIVLLKADIDEMKNEIL